MAEFDLATLLQQAQALQEKLRAAQEETAQKTVEASSGGGMVKVVVDGAMQVRKLEIDPAVFEDSDKTMIEDLIVAAVNEGLKRAQEMLAKEVGKLGALGGFKLP